MQNQRLMIPLPPPNHTSTLPCYVINFRARVPKAISEDNLEVRMKFLLNPMEFRTPYALTPEKVVLYDLFCMNVMKQCQWYYMSCICVKLSISLISLSHHFLRLSSHHPSSTLWSVMADEEAAAQPQAEVAEQETEKKATAAYPIVRVKLFLIQWAMKYWVIFSC